MFIAGYLDADQKASAEEFYAWSKQMSPNVVLSRGSMVPPVRPARLQSWTKDLNDLQDQIVKGKKPMSDFPAALKAWVEKYGKAVKDIYNEALSA